MIKSKSQYLEQWRAQGFGGGYKIVGVKKEKEGIPNLILKRGLKSFTLLTHAHDQKY